MKNKSGDNVGLEVGLWEKNGDRAHYLRDVFKPSSGKNLHLPYVIRGKNGKSIWTQEGQPSVLHGISAPRHRLVGVSCEEMFHLT